MHYKYLFLSMSCNDPFFEMSRKVVHDTWAKPILEGKFPGVGFYSYTAVSEAHPNPGIDGNCIYTYTYDNVQSTYIKTISAMQILANQGITWDIVIRTNTSTFFNVEEMLKLIDERGIDKFISFAEYSIHYNDEDIWLPTGWVMCLPEALTTRLIVNASYMNEWNDNWNKYFVNDYYEKYDDVLVGLFHHILKENDPTYNVEYSRLSRDYIKHYKTNLYNRLIQPVLDESYLVESENTNDPTYINHVPFMQLRLFGVETSYRYMECEHMYELYNELYPDMKRMDIINKLIEKYNYKNYLEIGLNNGKCFKQIKCKHKESCDPFIYDVERDHKYFEQDKEAVFEDGVLRKEIADLCTYMMTSDEMFEKNNKKYDLIFIDGLHERHQVIKDIKNALKHLNKKGHIVIHDCLPQEYDHQVVPRISGLWNGDVWKVLPYIKSKGVKFYVIDTDFGCGVIPYQDIDFDIEDFDYDYYEYFGDIEKRNELLNVKSVREFKKDVSN